MKLAGIKKAVAYGGLLVLCLVGLPAAVMGLAHSDLLGCDGCHMPHDSKNLPGVPLWNGSETTTTFVMYSSATFQATIDGQPSGPSKLCLSCHDGANPDFAWISAEHSFGANELAASHPISFVYDSALATLDGSLKDPSEPSTIGGTISEDLLDPDGKVQCTSCHDVHTSGVGDKLLRGYNYGREMIANPDGSVTTIHHGPELCRMCHTK